MKNLHFDTSHTEAMIVLQIVDRLLDAFSETPHPIRPTVTASLWGREAEVRYGFRLELAEYSFGLGLSVDSQSRLYLDLYRASGPCEGIPVDLDTLRTEEGMPIYEVFEELNPTEDARVEFAPFKYLEAAEFITFYFSERCLPTENKWEVAVTPPTPA